jgi:hypothetical protein
VRDGKQVGGETDKVTAGVARGEIAPPARGEIDLEAAGPRVGAPWIDGKPLSTTAPARVKFMSSYAKPSRCQRGNDNRDKSEAGCFDRSENQRE